MSHTLPERARSSYGEEHNRRIFEGAIGRLTHKISDTPVGGGHSALAFGPMHDFDVEVIDRHRCQSVDPYSLPPDQRPKSTDLWRRSYVASTHVAKRRISAGDRLEAREAPSGIGTLGRRSHHGARRRMAVAACRRAAASSCGMLLDVVTLDVRGLESGEQVPAGHHYVASYFVFDVADLLIFPFESSRVPILSCSAGWKMVGVRGNQSENAEVLVLVPDGDGALWEILNITTDPSMMPRLPSRIACAVVIIAWLTYSSWFMVRASTIA